MSDVMQHAKRFGLPAIIPLAILMSPARLLAPIRISAIASLLIMVLTPFTPLASLLPTIDEGKDWFVTNAETRQFGSLFNPNDYAYVAILATLIGLSHGAIGRRGVSRQNVYAGVGVVAGLVAVITSASRSGMIAALVAVCYLIFRSRFAAVKRLTIIGILTAAALIGWQLSSAYQSRMSTTLEQRMSDPGAASRLEAQSVAMVTWLHYPLGVGFSNMATATAPFSQNAEFFSEVGGSDSVYIDFLLATGVFGLSCIVLCFRTCWKLGEFRQSAVEAAFLRAGMLAAFCFGLAAIAPASYPVAPFFFTLVGLAGCLRRSQSLRSIVWS
jgi:hypothetical protein